MLLDLAVSCTIYMAALCMLAYCWRKGWHGVLLDCKQCAARGATLESINATYRAQVWFKQNGSTLVPRNISEIYLKVYSAILAILLSMFNSRKYKFFQSFRSKKLFAAMMGGNLHAHITEHHQHCNLSWYHDYRSFSSTGNMYITGAHLECQGQWWFIFSWSILLKRYDQNVLEWCLQYI